MKVLRPSLLVLFLLTCTVVLAQQSSSTPEEQAVWKLEHAYWQYVQAGDLAGYRSLWHEDFTGWPTSSPTPVHKDHITGWIEKFQAQGLRLASCDLEPAASRRNGSTVVTFYWIGCKYIDKSGHEHPDYDRITHTWVKSGDTWQIISGMSSAVSGPGK